MAIVDIEGVLPRVGKPARYTGGEWNSVVKEWEGAQVRFLLAYPDVYEAGGTSLGLNVLYHILNGQPDALGERAYAPWPDMEGVMRQQGLPLWSLETRHAVRDFDVIAFSLGNPLTYGTILNLLDLAGLPLRSVQRPQALPLVLAGGPVALNPEPMAEFIDAFALGDGEELVLDIADCIRRWKASGGGSKAELLRQLARIPSLYVPSFYNVRYQEDGTIAAVEAIDGAAPPRPAWRFLSKLPPPLTCPIVPFVETMQERAALEVQRGDAQGRPRLERDIAEVITAAKELLANTGYNELALISAPTSQHSQMRELAQGLRREVDDSVSISLPSLPPDRFSVEIAAGLAGRRRPGLAFALVAGSERLRFALGQAVKDEEALRAAELAFSRGWISIRLLFTLGLPGETREDILAIAELAAQMKDIGRGYHGGRARVRLSIGFFIPRPWTPWQWARQARQEELEEKEEALRLACRRRSLDAFWEKREQSLLAAILWRGDRRLGAVIERAWELGARLDAWREHFDWSRWQQAFAECGLDPGFYAYRQPGLGEKFPWSHLDVGVKEEELREQWLKASGEGYHPS